MRILAVLVILIFQFDDPAPRHLEQITYDIERKRLVLFGGVEINGGNFSSPSNVFEWDGTRWIEHSKVGPIGRRGHAFIYHPGHKASILIGGVTNGINNNDSILFDTWAWNGIDWQQLPLKCPVKEPKAVYDPSLRRILVYGDANNKESIDYNSPSSFQLWELQSGAWRKLSDSGPNITGSRAMAFDVQRNVLVVPIFLDEEVIVWEWNGEWKQIESSSESPAYRTRMAFNYHPTHKFIYLFGGLSKDRKQIDDLWKWDGKKWSRVSLSNSPRARNSAHFASTANNLLLYGGTIPTATGSTLSNELWEFGQEWIQKK